jgi:glycosyltransferase involved in cell wall biosynthesis
MHQVSLVIPCFNAASTLGATVESVLAQRIELELIVVDDGSTDDSLAIARSFGTALRALTGPNRGVSAARNRGIAETKSEWIIFLDADDLLLPGTIVKRLETAERITADVVICDWVVDESFRDRRVIDWANVNADPEIAFASGTWAPPGALMYRRGIVDKIGGFREEEEVMVSEDQCFLFEAAFHGARFVHSPHTGVYYRISTGSLSRHNPAQNMRSWFVAAKSFEEMWLSRGRLTDPQRKVCAHNYDRVARMHFWSGHPDYFEAVERQRAQGEPLSRHARIARPLARMIGLRRAGQVLRLLGRGG